ncbi:aldo/keto reductase [Alphaproteobacteria bacterium]|nr:aldo/keto reductase [Alphaproteobacteria bacterium]
MRMNTLGRTDIMVSALCLGSMTWGTQNTEAEGHAQIDLALDHGINFIDTAEMYPVNPLSKETQGDTERVIGSWIKSSGRREDIVLATKVSGEGLKYVRDGAPISPATIKQALDNSLTSLQTDYVDLYQLHWPNRGSYMFRQNWRFDPTSQNTTETEDHMLETLTYLNDLIREGKIRSIGLSNESCWGTMRWLHMAEKHNLPRMASIQNEYSLLCRLYDLDMAEMTHHEQVGLLSFSPLATGLLTGKYSADGQPPAGSRASISSDLGGRTTQRVWPAVAAYQDIADRFGLDLTAMSLAWCMQRSFMTSTIFGATSLDQMKQSLKATDMTLDQQVLTAIDSAHKAHPMPY